MYYKKQQEKEKGILTEISIFDNGKEVKEYHIALHITNPELSYNEQVTKLMETYCNLLKNELKNAVPIFKRYFLSDAANQAEILRKQEMDRDKCAISVIEQAPLIGTKIALWAYFKTNIQSQQLAENLFEIRHGGYRHLWSSDPGKEGADSAIQTTAVLDNYISQLERSNCNLADNCIRTWFFVNNIDVNYAGMVTARNEIFDKQNLTKETHFIASTGIGGGSDNPKTFVLMDAYAVDGLKAEQIQYLHAPSHLNPTHEYGVSFERGTCVKYGDRRQVFISGTASIDNKGEIVHPGDIHKQTQRMWNNVEALLSEAECSFDNLMHIIVYLRDPADYIVVKRLFDERFPTIPTIIVSAPVCRPGWLIEMECIAIKGDLDKRYNDF